MDAERFRLLVQAHQHPTFAAAYGVTRDRDEALDATQEAFLALYENLGAVRAASRGAWLRRVAINRALDRWRRARRQRPLDPAAVAPGAGPAERAARSEERDAVLGALARVSDRQRQVLTLRVWDRMTFPEIRAALAISEGAAKVHFRRGLQALRRLLKAHIPTGDNHGA